MTKVDLDSKATKLAGLAILLDSALLPFNHAHTRDSCAELGIEFYLFRELMRKLCHNLIMSSDTAEVQAHARAYISLGILMERKRLTGAI